MFVVVGLGNPGNKYEDTRHNIGFMVVDALSKDPSCEPFRSKFQAEIAELRDSETKILLVKPQTYMNLSGQSVRQVVDFYNLDLTQVLVVCDDINLPVGKLRFRPKGSHGGHNGLRDIQNHLGSNDYSRLRIGVGGPKDDTIDHVLGKFRPVEREKVQEAVSIAVQGVAVWWNSGIAQAMNEFNGP